MESVFARDSASADAKGLWVKKAAAMSGSGLAGSLKGAKREGVARELEKKIAKLEETRTGTTGDKGKKKK